MAHDPVADAVLGPLRDILQRYLRVVDVLVSSVDALEQRDEPQTDTTGTPSQPAHEVRPGTPNVEKSGELETILAFQERLSDVLGVGTVTLEGSDDRGFRFLVEMNKPPY